MDAPLTIGEAVAVLERTPAALAGMLRGLPDGWITATEGEGTWSPYVVVGHLIHAEHTDWMTRVRHILAGETRPFDPFDREAQFADSQGRTLDELLTTFAGLRRVSLNALAGFGLTAAELDRRGQHPSLGEVTLGQLLATWVVHDLDHVGQIARVMAKRYGAAVGPWQEYLSILRDRRVKG
jgi:uncharacterized damage-inducible protein DinB